jgi:hypothetical protein
LIAALKRCATQNRVFHKTAKPELSARLRRALSNPGGYADALCGLCGYNPLRRVMAEDFFCQLLV